MSPVLSEILRSGFTINSSLRRRTHLVQSLSVVFLYWFYIGSEEDLMDLKKRKRMQSNRESARKSRMRKQKHLDDLTDQINQMKKDNAQILATINMTTPQYVKVEAENSVLRAQMSELSQRLDYLNEIINLMSYNSTSTSNHHCMSGGVFEFDYHHDLMNNPWSAAEMLQY
ncbi:putative transcription factor bZIP family [Helianthus annuus]|nr:putative transcription factor bZIP family [Helianthus annuus]